MQWGERSPGQPVSNLGVNCKEALSHLVEAAGLPQQVASELNQLESVSHMINVLSEAEQTEAVQNLTPNPLGRRTPMDGVRKAEGG